ncbi:hypothetical protein BGZ96_005703 [Linnemannia gamsii]|uniref:Uncharacterized protein n=1 Tax=Linnemannia gamsii TaxID=64522 RepID=A0ABQ7KH22_9FUNG|nr:hypothetical protein BGZ96_005703 [Linnemannia gamsii]
MGQDPQVAAANITSTKNGKRPESMTTEPWRSLVFQLIDTLNEKETPRIAATDYCASLSTSHSLLYQHSVKTISAYGIQESKAKDILLLKQAQDSMSCCLNTMSQRTCTDFHEMGQSSLIEAAKEFATIPGFEDHPCYSILDKYLPRLKKEQSVEKFGRFLVVQRGKLNEPAVDLDALPPELEVEDKVLDILIKLGEQMLEATKVIKKELSDEFGDVSDSGRKCDLVFRFSGIEVSNIEFKRAETSARDLAVQSSKNVRLARCIQESHVKLGMSKASVLMGDVAGFIGAFYQLKYMGDITIAGTTASSTAQLPRSRGALLAFMQDKSLAMLFNYVRKVMSLEEMKEMMSTQEARRDSSPSPTPRPRK